MFLMSGLSGCYTVRQAWHQNNLFNTRRPLPDVISDPLTRPEIKAKLQLAETILGYAQAAGLNTDGAYTHYIETGQKRVSYLVQAAYVDRLEPVTWWFPIVGRVPYLGFFAAEERDAKAATLVQEGYDVHTTGVGAFSSLGWFSDPVFTSMLKRDVEQLASLLFHELTHRTFWISGSVKFNENLAEYVADYLTPRFLQAHGFDDRIEKYEEMRRDRTLYKGWLKRLRKDLQNLFEQRATLPRELLLQRKSQIFERYTAAEKPKFLTFDFVERVPWNNATVVGASLYQPDLQRFARAHACLGQASVIDFLETLDERADAYEEPFQALDSLCSK